MSVLLLEDIAPISGLDNAFPDKVFVLHHKLTNRYGCYYFEGVHGLACFSDEIGAVRFSEFIELSGLSTSSHTFDEAREIAKDRPLPVTALMLLDDMKNPIIHYVR